MRATTLKASGDKLAGLLDYYAGLAEDQQRRDGGRWGPVDYYLDPDEPPGRWWGAGCPAVGLAGDVAPEQLRALLLARHPGTGEPLGRRFGAKSARGYDATFSAPKSVSLLWALSPNPWVRAEVLAAHDTAVTAALYWLAGHGAVARRGTDGVHQVDTRGLVAALFRQHTSRTADPQLHTHAIVWSKVQDPTGRWLALDARLLKRQQRSIGWVYDAALRAELTARLGVGWEPAAGGQADLVEVPEGLREVFSQRSAQVEVQLASVLRRWVDDHDGAEPGPRTVARFERDAVLDSRPAKQRVGDVDALRAEWCERAKGAGFVLPATAAGDRQLPGFAEWDREAVVDEALARVSGQGSAWLRADLAREIATLVPASVAGPADELVALVDELAEEAAGRCVELHPPPPSGTACRADGRPVTEAVTDRLLSTPAILAQERRLLGWAASAVRSGQPGAEVVAAGQLDDEQAAAATAIDGTAPLVLVVGPAGTGKTATLAAAVGALRSRGRPVLGLAPSGKATDVLAAEAGCHAVTLAKLLHEHDRRRHLGLPAGTTVLLDEAGMAATDDLDRLVVLARRERWRLVCVGDPDQLPAVGRGGVFAHWCDTLPVHRLEQVRRFAEAWQAEASRGLRAGDPRAVAAYAEHGRLKATHPTLLAERVARQHEALVAAGATVAVTTASTAVAREVNLAVQHRSGSWRSGPSVRLADRTLVFAGDRVATRRNDRSVVTDSGTPVRNRQTWTVVDVGADGSLTVAEPERGRAVLPAGYVRRDVELGWAVTGYGSQGVTVDHGICVVEPGSTRAGVYVGMTRGRHRNVAWMLDESGLADPAEVLVAVLQRPANAVTALAARDRLYAQHGQVVADQEAQRLLDDGHRGQALAPRPTPSLGL